MSSEMIGFLVVFAIVHALLITLPIMDVIKAPFPLKSKLLWPLILLLLPLVGIGFYRLLYKSSLAQSERYEVNVTDLRARSGTLSGGNPDSKD